MKSPFRLFRRNSGIWFWENRQTGQQGSFCTRDKAEANRLLNAKNEALEIPALNIEMAKVYLNAADPTLSKRTWRYTVEQLIFSSLLRNLHRARGYKITVAVPSRCASRY